MLATESGSDICVGETDDKESVGVSVTMLKAKHKVMNTLGVTTLTAKCLMWWEVV